MLCVIYPPNRLLCRRAFFKTHARRSIKCILSFQFTFIYLNATPRTLRAQPRNQVLIKTVDSIILLLRYKHEIFSLCIIHSHIASLFALLEPGARLVPHLLKPGHIHQHRLRVLHHLRSTSDASIIANVIPSLTLVMGVWVASSTLNSPHAVTL